MRSIHAKGRDNARTPMQWDKGKNAGFTEGTPWIKVNPNYTEINAKAALEDKNSVFYYYKKLIELRKKYNIFVDGRFELILQNDPNILSYIRESSKEKLLIVANFYEIEIPYKMSEECWNRGKIKNRGDGCSRHSIEENTLNELVLTAVREYANKFLIQEKLFEQIREQEVNFEAVMGQMKRLFV